MSDIIQTDAAGVNDLSQKIKEELRGYIYFFLFDLSILAHVLASGDHDDMEYHIQHAQKEWAELITSDVESLKKIHENFKSVDEAAMLQILGVGV